MIELVFDGATDPGADGAVVYFIGTDSVDAEPIRQFHEGDVFVPVDPDTLAPRLEAAGFTDVHIDVGDYEIRFHATKPSMLSP